MSKYFLNWRYNFLLFPVIVFAGIVLYHLFSLQVSNFKTYQAQALSQQVRLEELVGERGRVFFNDGEIILAFNKTNKRVYAVPKEIDDKEKTAEKLSKILNYSQENIFERIDNERYYVVLKNELSEEKVILIQENKIKGVYLEEYSARYYPQNNMASQVIGFLGGVGDGQYGIEGYYNEVLRGETRVKEKNTGIFEYLFNLDDTGFNLRGTDLYLTLDYGIQFKAESLLKKAHEVYGIEGGQIIVVDPNSGEILALADSPSFNPNEYGSVSDLSIFMNKSIQNKFEPGSVFKIITAVIGLNEGKITPETKYVDKGFIKVGPETIRNYNRRTWGEVTTTKVIENSINTGAVFIQKLLPNDVFLEYIEKFGFTEKTNIDLHGEILPRNVNFNEKREINFATASFGQGIAVTPIQLVRSFIPIANGGDLINPFIVKKTVDAQGGIETKEPEIRKNIISSRAASQVTSMMVSTIEKGFSKRAKIEGYYIAGKTGTSQVSYDDRPGYRKDKTIQSFIGFGPAFDSRFLILVKLDNPNTSTAEYSALPIFRELASYIIKYWHIPPDYD